jgi:DNA-binding transcriptional regulator YhcF (GntR family)
MSIPAAAPTPGTLSPVPGSRRGTWRAVAVSVADAIRDGDLHIGDRLPTTRDLRVDWSASSATIARAFDALEARGIVERWPRDGVYVKAVPVGPLDFDATPGTARRLDTLEQRLTALEREVHGG